MAMLQRQRLPLGGALRRARASASLVNSRETSNSCRSRVRHVTLCVAAPAELSPFEWEFQHSETNTKVRVFGVDHRFTEDHIGRYILLEKPDAVIVETACNPIHGSTPGNLVSCEDYFEGADGFFLRMFCAIAAKLREVGPDALKPGEVWEQIIEQYRGEQLAYIAAFTIEAQLVYGDRPKDVTLRRLWHEAGAMDYDEAFGLQAALNYREQVTGQPQQADPEQLCKMDRIMMQEREAVMLRVLDDMCRGVLPQSPLEEPPKHVVLVAGGDHLPGLRQMWEKGTWRQLLALEPGAPLESSPLLNSPAVTPADMAQPGAGVKRGLLDAAFCLSAAQELLTELDKVLPPLAPEEEEAYAYVSEIYGATRMLLACLPQELLAQVVGSYGGSEFSALLAPLRDVRLVNGGPGWSHEVWSDLVALNYMFGGAEE